LGHQSEELEIGEAESEKEKERISLSCQVPATQVEVNSG
jgi:hypothetical protein